MPRMLPVLLGGDANVYGMARSFYECYGVRSLAVCRRALPALAHSRLVRVAVQDPAFGQDHVFTATLLGLAAQYPGVPKILISCADDYTALLARHADALRGAYRFACPPPAALHLADKRQFAAACRAAGLRTPHNIEKRNPRRFSPSRRPHRFLQRDHCICSLFRNGNEFSVSIPTTGTGLRSLFRPYIHLLYFNYAR